MDYFESVQGQEIIKKKLSFFIEAYKKSGLVPPLLFAGEKGSGKTTIARLFAKQLHKFSNDNKPLVTKNCGGITSVKLFVENVLEPMENKTISILFDECHALPPKVVTALLTILGGGDEVHTQFEYENVCYEFDLSKQTFLFATTDRQKMVGPLRDRLEPISFGEYSMSDLGSVLQYHAKDVEFTPESLARLGSFCRGNPRSASQMAHRIVKNYCLVYDKTKLGLDDIEDLKGALGLFELGLDEIEIRIMRALDIVHDISLTALSAKTGAEKAAQQDAEKYLLKMGLMEIDGGRRSLTTLGKKYMEKYNYGRS